MSGQLSPDGNYYWDGIQWARAITPDGAWRWDGRAWRPAGQAPSRTGGRTAALIAVGIVAALLVVGLGIFGVTRVFYSAQRSLESSLSPSCAANGMPGAALTAGESLCGGKLGVSLLSVDCTAATALPSGIVAEQTSASSQDWTAADIGMDSSGCEMAAQPDVDLGIDSSEVQPADLVLVADFVPLDVAGSVGARLACSDTGSCLDVLIDSQETYSLAEGVPSDGWKTLKEGPLALAYLRTGAANRLILRFAGGVVSVFLNGYELAHATPDLVQVSGFLGFYVDNEQSTKTDRVQLRQMYVFQAL